MDRRSFLALEALLLQGGVASASPTPGQSTLLEQALLPIARDLNSDSAPTCA